MKSILFFVIFAVPLFPRQDEHKKSDSIAITIPKFYEATLSPGGWANDAPKLIYPKTANYRYFVNIVDLRGFCVEPNHEIDQERFYTIIRAILRYGVADHPRVFPNLNIYFLHLIKRLLDFGAIDAESIAQLRAHYTSMNWVESLYYLEEAVPGTISAVEWRRIQAVQSSLAGVNGSRCSYFEFLCALKAGSSISRLLESADQLFDRESFRDIFDDYAKIYGALMIRGAVVRPNVIKKLAWSYIDTDEKYEYGFMAASRASGIQFPREIIEEVLTGHI